MLTYTNLGTYMWINILIAQKNRQRDFIALWWLNAKLQQICDSN